MRKPIGIVMGIVMGATVLGTAVCAYAAEAEPKDQTMIEAVETVETTESIEAEMTEAADMIEAAETTEAAEMAGEDIAEAAPEGMILGGWQMNGEAAEGTLPENVKAAFEKAMDGLVGMNYTPVVFLGSQIVAGTNYRILCVGTPVIPDPQPGFYVITVYEDLEGNASINEIKEIDLAKIEETAAEDAQAPEGMLLGGWTVPDTIEAGELPEDAQKAFDETVGKLLGVQYIPAAVLGTKVIAGTEYAILCHATPAVETPVCYYAAAFIAAKPDGTFELMNLVPLNVAEFEDPVE